MANEKKFLHFVSQVGVARIGICTSRAKLTNIGGDAYSWGYGGTGKKSHNAVFTTWGQPYSTGIMLTDMRDFILIFRCDNWPVAESKDWRSRILSKWNVCGLTSLEIGEIADELVIWDVHSILDIARTRFLLPFV